MRYKFVTAFIIILIFIFGNVSSPFARTVTVSWNPNTENDLAGYKVFVGQQSHSYDTSHDVGKVEECQLDLPNDGNDHYLALKAYDYAGNESEFSEEVVVAGGTNPSAASAAEYVSLYRNGYRSYIGEQIKPEILSGEEVPANGQVRLGIGRSNTSQGSFRIFLPPGTMYMSFDAHTIGLETQVVMRFSHPPVSAVYDRAHEEVFPSFSDIRDKDVFSRGNTINFNTRFAALSEGGWLYVKVLDTPLRSVSILTRGNSDDLVAWLNNREGTLIWDINGDPWSADHGIAAARVCTASDPDACLTQYECANVAAHWYGGACNAEVACTADELYLCDDDRTRCANSGYYWYDGLCNEKAACTVDDLYACDSRERCEGSGFYWDGDSCQAQSPCQRGVLSACSSREDCQAGGGFWYNGECRRSLPTSSGGSSYSGSGSGGSSYSPPSSGTSSSGSSSFGSASFSGLGSLFSMQSSCGPDNLDGCNQGACEELGAGYWWYGSCRPRQQIETYGNDSSRISAAPVRLGDDADDGTISAGEGMSIHLDVPANVRTYAVLVFPNGEYFFLDNNDYFTKRVVPVTSGELPVADNLCAVLEDIPELTGEWGVGFLTVPASVEPFQSLNDIVDYINNGGTYHFGSYVVMVGCQ